MAWLLSLLYLAEDHPDLSLRVLWYVGDMFDIPSDYGDCFVIYQISQIQDRYFSKSFAPVDLCRPKCSTNCLLLCSYLSCSTCCLRFFSWSLNSFQNELLFSKCGSFSNVLSFSKCERFGECCFSFFSEWHNCKQNLYIH